jgi:HK97 family phage major capsid protein
MANSNADPGHIVVPSTDPLSRIAAMVEKTHEHIEAQASRIQKIEDLASNQIPEIRTEVAERVTELRSALESQKLVVETLETRIRTLDDLLPKGGKFWQPEGRALNDPGTIKTGELILDHVRAAKGQREKHGWYERAQTEGTLADGGYSVPEEQANEIINLLQKTGFARTNCRRIPMNRQVMRLPVSAGGPTVYWPDESTAPANESKVTLARPTLTAKKMLAIDTISIELDEDADSSFMQFLVDTFTNAVGLEEDRQMLAASSQAGSVDVFTGILFQAGVTEITLGSGSVSFHQLDYNALIDVFDAAHERTQEDGIWVMSNYTWNMIRKVLVTSQKEPLMAAVPSAMPSTLFGRPVYLSSVMPRKAQSTISKSFLAFGDFPRFALFGDRRQFSIDVSPHADFKAGNLVMRFMERVAVQYCFQSSFARLKTAAS